MPKIQAYVPGILPQSLSVPYWRTLLPASARSAPGTMPHQAP